MPTEYSGWDSSIDVQVHKGDLYILYWKIFEKVITTPAEFPKQLLPFKISRKTFRNVALSETADGEENVFEIAVKESRIVCSKSSPFTEIISSFRAKVQNA